MKYLALLMSLALLSACGGKDSPTAPTQPQRALPHVVSIGNISWGYRPQDSWSSFSGQVQNTGQGCTGPLVSGVATLWNSTAKVSSGLFTVMVNSVTNVMRPGETAEYRGDFRPAVAPGTTTTHFTLEFELSDANMARTCP